MKVLLGKRHFDSLDGIFVCFPFLYQLSGCGPSAAATVRRVSGNGSQVERLVDSKSFRSSKGWIRTVHSSREQ
jgi:hypothetical protein